MAAGRAHLDQRVEVLPVGVERALPDPLAPAHLDGARRDADALRAPRPVGQQRDEGRVTARDDAEQQLGDSDAARSYQGVPARTKPADRLAYKERAHHPLPVMRKQAQLSALKLTLAASRLSKVACRKAS